MYIYALIDDTNPQALNIDLMNNFIYLFIIIIIF